MSNVPPNQPSPFATAPTHATKPKGNTSALAVILIVCAVGFVGLLACGGLLVALLLPAVSSARTAARNMSRSNDLKQVGLAIHNYHSTYKQLPPTVIVNQDGQETSGWRVALAPFLDIPTVGSEIADMPVEAPVAYNGMIGSPSETHTFAIVAPNSLFSPTPNTHLRFRHATDGLANTLLAINLPNRSADWRSSVNMTPDEAYQAVQELAPNQVGLLLMADGAVIQIRADDDFGRAKFDAWVSRDGGELHSSDPI